MTKNDQKWRQTSNSTLAECFDTLNFNGLAEDHRANTQTLVRVYMKNERAHIPDETWRDMTKYDEIWQMKNSWLNSCSKQNMPPKDERKRFLLAKRLELSKSPKNFARINNTFQGAVGYNIAPQTQLFNVTAPNSGVPEMRLQQWHETHTEFL